MTKLLENIDLEDLHDSLLAWYHQVKRSLPWRQQPSLYGTWISEIMLQQTTVQTVTPYWQRFVRQFPDVDHLAAATEEQVLSFWSGLGYYRRARLLHEAARLIVAVHGGKLPSNRDAWLDLPGIGPYTAGAIASIGAGQSVPAVDANARRVLTRWLCRTSTEATALKPAVLNGLAQQLVHRQKPGDWNQAIMELGALVCTPKRPHCGECPVYRHCRAGTAGRTKEVPPPPRKQRTTKVLTHLLVARCRGAVLLWHADAAPVVRFRIRGRPVPRRPQGLWRGLLGLPSGPWYLDETPPGKDARHFQPGDDVRKGWQNWFNHFARAVGGQWRVLGQVRHAVTTYRLRCQVTEVVLPQRPGALSQAHWYQAGRDQELPLTALARKALEMKGL